jgi:hypothetical protein
MISKNSRNSFTSIYNIPKLPNTLSRQAQFFGAALSFKLRQQWVQVPGGVDQMKKTIERTFFATVQKVYIISAVDHSTCIVELSIPATAKSTSGENIASTLSVDTAPPLHQRWSFPVF